MSDCELMTNRRRARGPAIAIASNATESSASSHIIESTNAVQCGDDNNSMNESKDHVQHPQDGGRQRQPEEQLLDEEDAPDDILNEEEVDEEAVELASNDSEQLGTSIDDDQDSGDEQFDHFANHNFAELDAHESTVLSTAQITQTNTGLFSDNNAFNDSFTNNEVAEMLFSMANHCNLSFVCIVLYVGAFHPNPIVYE